MKKLLETTIIGALGAGFVLGASLVHPTEAFAQSSATVGSLRGVLKDKATGEAAVGATVVATSPALVGEQVVLTDENGQYFITSLPPGVYTLTIYYNDRNFSRSNVLIQVGKEVVVNVTVDSSAPAAGGRGGEVIEISGSAPIVDQGSTKTGLTLTDDYTRNIPTGRTFGGVLGSAAGSQDDQYGVSLSGATSAENVYVVEGINTTDTGFGGISSNLPNEFISETEVITGGYNAEFGRATGGIVNVVTKSGSNTFKGSVFGYYRPGALVADAETIQREGGSIDTEANLAYAYDVGAEVGGPIIKDKLWFHVGINPSSSKTEITRLVQQQIDRVDAMGNPIMGGDGVADVDPDTGLTLHEEVPGGRSIVNQQLTTYFFTAKINGAINQNNQFQISAFGNPRSGDAATASMNRNPEFTNFQLEDGAYDVSAKWTSKFAEGKTQIDAVVGHHRGFENQIPNSGQDVPLVRYNFERSLYDFAAYERNIDACNDNDPNDPYPNIRNCPTFLYSTQGLGFLEERVNARTSGVVALTQRVKAAGYHTFKVGVDAELSTYNSTRGNSGGAVLTRRRLGTATLTGDWQLRQLMAIAGNITDEEAMLIGEDADMNGVDDAVQAANTRLGVDDGVLCAGDRALCTPERAIAADTNNTGIAAFVQDSWQVRPNLTLNLGVRWEQQTGYVAKSLQGRISPEGEVIPDAAYKLENMWAPRLGVIYDPTQEGKSKIFAHWGRFYESVPMDINVRAFGGEITNFTLVNATRRNSMDPGYDPNCDVDIAAPGENLADVLLQCQDRRSQAILGGGTEFVSPGMKGQYTQEIILGAEYELIPDLKIGFNYIHRTLPVVIEDVSTDGGNHYLITNPGENLDAEAADLRNEANQILAAGGCMSLTDESDTCDQEQRALAALQDGRADQMEYVKNFDKPTRNYDALQLTAVQRPTKRSLLQASYTYSQSKGNYPGLFSTETGQLDPNLTSLYDLPDLMANRYGFLGLDRPHNFKVDGFYQFDFKKAGLLTTGVSFRAQSGIAHNALAAHITYGDGESYILPRGAFARSPVTTQTDVHLSYGYRLSKSTTLEGFVRIFNLFNSQEELDTDENYTFDPVVPIVGGDREDLRHVKALDGSAGTETNSTPFVNKNFGKLNARQAPQSVQLGFRLTF